MMQTNFNIQEQEAHIRLWQEKSKQKSTPQVPGIKFFGLRLTGSHLLMTRLLTEVKSRLFEV